MSITTELEDLALGEVTLAEAAATVTAALKAPDREDMAYDLYEALRSWLWKTLESRRRDPELAGWMDLFSRVAVRLGDTSRDLATKLEGFMELLHASIMTADAAERRDPFLRKHVGDAMTYLYSNGGKLRRGALMEMLRLKAPNLSRVMTPLIDDGFVMREVDGREVLYRLTMKGHDATSRHLSREGGLLFVDVGAALEAVRSPKANLRVRAWLDRSDQCTFGGGYALFRQDRTDGYDADFPPYQIDPHAGQHQPGRARAEGMPA